MRTTIRTKALAGSAAALLALSLAACTNDPEPDPTTIEAAPTDDTSDGGGDPSTEPSDDSQADVAACTLPDGDQSLPNEAPEVDEWVMVQGIGVPTSEAYGPQAREGDLFTCYAHSPTGALFASAYAFAAVGGTEGFADAWLPPGPEQDEIRAAEGSAADNGTGTLSGYRINAASADQFVVDLAFTYMTENGQGIVAQRITLTWADDHWELDPSTFSSDPSPVDDLTGFTPWSANG